MPEPTEPTVVNNAPQRAALVGADALRSPIAYALAICLVLFFVTTGVVAIAKQHRSALEICTDNGGSYEVYAKTCTMPTTVDKDGGR